MPALQGSNRDIDASAEALTSASNLFDYECWVKAKWNNGGKVYVGFANTVTAGTVDATDGYELSAGEEICIPAVVVRDTAEIFLIGSTTNQVVYWICY